MLRVDKEDIDLIESYKWNTSTKGNYWRRTQSVGDKKITLYLHKVIGERLGFFDTIVDHIDGDVNNNCRYNLRKATKAENNTNRKKTQEKTSSIYKGVTWNKRGKYWQANIRIEGRLYFLGAFQDEIDAAKVYNKAATERNPEFKSLNIIVHDSFLSIKGDV